MLVHRRVDGGSRMGLPSPRRFSSRFSGCDHFSSVCVRCDFKMHFRPGETVFLVIQDRRTGHFTIGRDRVHTITTDASGARRYHLTTFCQGYGFTADTLFRAVQDAAVALYATNAMARKYRRNQV